MYPIISSVLNPIPIAWRKYSSPETSRDSHLVGGEGNLVHYQNLANFGGLQKFTKKESMIYTAKIRWHFSLLDILQFRGFSCLAMIPFFPRNPWEVVPLSPSYVDQGGLQPLLLGSLTARPLNNGWLEDFSGATG